MVSYEAEQLAAADWQCRRRHQSSEWKWLKHSTLKLKLARIGIGGIPWTALSVDALHTGVDDM